MCFEGKLLQNRLRADKNESRFLLAVDIQGHQKYSSVYISMQGLVMRVLIKNENIRQQSPKLTSFLIIREGGEVEIGDAERGQSALYKREKLRQGETC